MLRSSVILVMAFCFANYAKSQDMAIFTHIDYSGVWQDLSTYDYLTSTPGYDSDSASVSLLTPNYTPDLLSVSVNSLLGGGMLSTAMDEQPLAGFSEIVNIGKHPDFHAGATLMQWRSLTWRLYDPDNVNGINSNGKTCDFLFDFNYGSIMKSTGEIWDFSIKLNDNVVAYVVQGGDDYDEFYLIGDGNYFPLSTYLGSKVSSAGFWDDYAISLGTLIYVEDWPVHSRMTISAYTEIYGTAGVGDDMTALISFDAWCIDPIINP